MPHAGNLLRFAVLTAVIGAAMLVPPESLCRTARAADVHGPAAPTLTLSWGIGAPECILTLTGRVTETGQLRLSGGLVSPGNGTASAAGRHRLD